VTHGILMLRCLTARLCSPVTFAFALARNCFRFVILCPAKCITSSCTSFQVLIGRRVAFLYAVTFLLVLPVLFRDARHSAFYLHLNKIAVKESMQSANSLRIVEAEKYFCLLNRSGTLNRRMSHGGDVSDEVVTVALTIITVSRNRHEIDSYEPKYLTQTVWKFRSLLGKWQLHNRRLRVHMSICNVDSLVTRYHEADTLSKFVPMFSRFNETHFSLVHTLEKEKEDYLFCLNKSLEVNKADYVFLVEDDAFPTDDVFDVLQRVILMHTERSFVRGEFRSGPSDVAFVKFYHPERLLGFISIERERLPELFSYAAILSTLLTLVYAASCGFTATGNGVGVNACWTRLFLFSLIVMLSCGRTGISEWRRLASPSFYSYTTAPSCCTPAMLFPRSTALLTVKYLNSSTCTNNFGKDSLLDKMLQDLHLTAYLVQPNTFTHIGVYSSLRLRIVDPFMV